MSQFFFKRKRGGEGRRENLVLITSMCNSVPFFNPNEVRFPEVFGFTTWSYRPVRFGCLLFWYSVTHNTRNHFTFWVRFLSFHEWFVVARISSCESSTHTKMPFLFPAFCLQVEENIPVALPKWGNRKWLFDLGVKAPRVPPGILSSWWPDCHLPHLVTLPWSYEEREAMPFWSISNFAFKSGLKTMCDELCDDFESEGWYSGHLKSIRST